MYGIFNGAFPNQQLQSGLFQTRRSQTLYLGGDYIDDFEFHRRRRCRSTAVATSCGRVHR